MAGTSTLGFAILGLLARQPRTGYELSAALRKPVGYFWTASHSQIYPELARLETARYVRHRVIKGPGPRDTKRYVISNAGRRALQNWVSTTTSQPATRDEFLLKVYSLWLVEPTTSAALVRDKADEHRATLREYERLQREHERLPAATLFNPARPEFSSYATLRRGVSFERHAIAWCEWLVTALEAGQP